MSVLMEQHLAHQAARARLGMAPPPKPRMAVSRTRVARPLLAAKAEVVVVAPFAPFNFYARPSAAAIIKLVALRHGVGYYDIIGRNNRREVTRARHQAVKLVVSHCPSLSSTQVGRIFHRDHSSILYILGRHHRNGAVNRNVGPVDKSVYLTRVVDAAHRKGDMEDHLASRRVVQ